MSPGDLASEYIRAYCAGDLDALEQILDEDLCFHGPLYSFYSRKAYVESLRADPPVRADHRIIQLVEAEGSAAVFWEYQKPDHSMVLAQYFETTEDRIREILLVFDTGTPPPDRPDPI